MEGMLVFGPQGGLCERYDIMTAKELQLDDLYVIVKSNCYSALTYVFFVRFTLGT